MKIGFFSDSYFPEIDGVTYTLQLWKEKLEEKGHKVYIIYPESEKHTPKEREIPVKSVPNPFYSGYNVPVPTSFEDLPNDLDIVHCHTPLFLGVAGRIYANRIDASTVYTHHTPIEEYFIQNLKSQHLSNLLTKLYVPTEEYFLSKFDKVLSNTDGGRRNIEMNKLAAGIDLEFFQPKNIDWSLDSPIIGYSGRISDEKNIEEIIKLEDKIEGTIVIVGEGPAKEKLKNNASENVIFKDFLDREKLPGYYSMLDVFVTASTGDTLGLSPLEANACGTPVVAADTHPFDKTIDEQNGFTYEPNNLEDFKHKIQKALSQEWETRKNVEKYSLKKSINRIEQIYVNLAN